VRDALDVRGAMLAVLIAVTPAAVVGITNAGHQALLAARRGGLESAPGWLGTALDLPAAPESLWTCILVGASFALPVLVVASSVAWAWSSLFARVRGRSSPEPLAVVVVLFALLLPPSIPLWQVALGISFAVVIGLEIFGGLGRNLVNPALAGLAFLYFAYPASFSGAGTWSSVPDVPAPTVLFALAGGLPTEIPWLDSFLGREPGALGETSALACLLGAAFLVYAGLASWRIMLGAVAGLIATCALLDASLDPDRLSASLPWYWHLTTGSFAFGVAFLATDPVTSATTRAGRWIYGVGIGFLVVLIRVLNPNHPEGVMMAILLGNVLAPLIDAVVVRVHRLRRTGRRG
jgi:Na+-transporting NADH:ubiquinone oxidoreductase subunit B